MVRGMMDCLLARCIPCVSDCVIAELEKLGAKYKIALRIAKDARFQRLTCTHRGTYADDCIVKTIRQHRCYVVATCDKDLRRRIRKVSLELHMRSKQTNKQKEYGNIFLPCPYLADDDPTELLSDPLDGLRINFSHTFIRWQSIYALRANSSSHGLCISITNTSSLMCNTTFAGSWSPNYVHKPA